MTNTTITKTELATVEALVRLGDSRELAIQTVINDRPSAAAKAAQLTKTTKQITNVLGSTVSLTEMELRVYDSIKLWGEMEDCHADCAENISDNTGIPIKQIRGVISSLVQKDLAYVDELAAGCGDAVILFEKK